MTDYDYQRPDDGSVTAKMLADDVWHVTTADPTVNDDIDLGYIVGSKWMNSTSGDTFICEDNSDGAADWRLMVVVNISGQIAGPMILHTGTAAEINAIQLPAGQMAYTSDTETLRIGDGVEMGGNVWSKD